MKMGAFIGSKIGGFIGAGYGFYVVNHAMGNILDIENVLDEGYKSLYPWPISLFL